MAQPSPIDAATTNNRKTMSRHLRNIPSLGLSQRATPTRGRQAAWAGATCLVCLAGATPGAVQADEPNPWYLGASQTLTQQSNLFRIGRNVAGAEQTLPAGVSKSDLVSTTALVGGIDQPIGRQRLYGSINLADNRYRHNSQLNTPSHNLNLALDWSTVERLSGSLGYADNKRQVQFNTLNSASSVETRRNIVDTRRVNAVARLGLVTKLTAEAQWAHERVDYSAPEYAFREYRQDSLSLGLNYKPSGLLALGAALRQTRGEYPLFSALGADRFTRDDLDLSANWQPSQVSQFSARLSATRTRYEQDSLRNSSGPTGYLSWNWQPTGKLRLRADLARDFGQSAYAADFGALGTGVIDYSTTRTTWRLRVDQDISAKIALSAALTQVHRALVNTAATTAATLGVVRGSDDTVSVSLGARWTPTRNILLSCDLNHDQRRTNTALSTRMSAAVFGCSGQLTLQ
jgi:hypothetical protein